MSSALRVILVIACWCAIAGGVTPADLVGAAAVALVVELMLGGAPRRLLRVAPPLGRLLVAVFADLVASSLRIAADVLRPRPRLRPRVVAVETDLRGDHLITALANAISLTPGSLTIEADAERGRLRVHLCYGDEAERWAADLERGVAARIAAIAAVVQPERVPPRGSVELVP